MIRAPFKIGEQGIKGAGFWLLGHGIRRVTETYTHTASGGIEVNKLAKPMFVWGWTVRNADGNLMFHPWRKS